jgi:hypothetical protein
LKGTGLADLDPQLRNYIAGFSPNMREVLERFGFDKTISKLDSFPRIALGRVRRSPFRNGVRGWRALPLGDVSLKGSDRRPMLRERPAPQRHCPLRFFFEGPINRTSFVP